MKFDFEYSLSGDRGYCRGCSYAQAIDNAKVRYLASKGIKLNTTAFYLEKPKLHTPKLRFTGIQNQRFVELYRCAKDGELTPSEREELNALIPIVRNL